MSATDLAAGAEHEVRALHDFFVAWLTGRAPAGDLDRLTSALHPDCVRIAPDGAVQDRDAIVAMLAGANGALGPEFRIDIALEATAPLADHTVLVRYVEHQSSAADTTARRATAIFVASPTSPGGVAWRWLQETWIDQTKA